MRRLLLSLFYKQIFSRGPITSLSLFLLYIVVTPLIIGFEKHFLCHFHLGLIWISLFFSFLSKPFFRNEREDGTLDFYYLSASSLPKILLSQLVVHQVIQISLLFCGFPIIQLLYQFDPSGIDLLNILLGSTILTLLFGIHSSLAIGSTSSWNSLQNLSTLPTLLPLILFCTFIEREWFHVLLLIGYFFLFISLYLILVSISSQD